MDLYKCAICKPHNKTIYVHKEEDGGIWLWCNKCGRGYSLYDYCTLSGLTVKEILSADLTIQESTPSEVRKMDWPGWFVSPFDFRAKKGLEYLSSRKIDPTSSDVFYDLDTEAIVFPYYYHGIFVGAQKRYITPRIVDDKEQKIDTLPGTRLGLLTYGYDQKFLPTNVKIFIVAEGAFNCLSLSQMLNKVYGGHLNNPYKCIALSGSGLSQHQSEILKEKKDLGYKIILAPDSDSAGMTFLSKAHDLQCITHFSITEDTEVDWNDLLINTNQETLFRTFFKNMKEIAKV